MEPSTKADSFAAAAGVLAAISAACGLALPGLYRDVPFWAQQARGTDVATLFLAVPILFAGLWTARRGSLVGRLAAVAGLLYLIYNYAIFAFSVVLNPLLGLYLTTLSLAVWSFALWLTSSGPPQAETVGLPRRLTAGVLIGVAIVFGLLWLSQIASATVTGEVPVDLQRAELPTNPVWALDLAFFLPLCVVAALALLRGRPAGAFALPMLIWLCLTSVGIVAAFVFATLEGEPFAIVPGSLVGAIGGLTGALAAFGAVRTSKSGARR